VRYLSLLVLAGSALALALPAAAPAAQLVVARDHGLSATERADLRRHAGVRHGRDLRLRDVEVVTVPDAEAAGALAALRADPDVRWAERDRRVHAFATNDTYYPVQWGLPTIGAPAAWSVATGAGQIVAVVDTGVDATHPDLQGQLDPRGASTDPNGHGTHVSGIIAAATGNGIGIAGVAPGARVLALQAVGADGTGLVSDVADAEATAADMGARVVNLSLGGDASSLAELAAISSHPGTLFVAAAGNDGQNVDTSPVYPCAYALPNVLCVGAEAQGGGAASFSNTGAHAVDVFAPGVGIASTWPGGKYVYADGTSMATPFVSAAAALVLEHDPSLTPAQVRQLLIDSSDPTAALAGKAVGGDLDVARALGTSSAPADPSPATPPEVPVQQPAATPPAPALSQVHLRGRLVRSCAGRSRHCQSRNVVLRWRLARAGALGVAWQRRTCSRGRCRWATVSTWRTSAPAGPASASLGAASAGRTLPAGKYRFAIAALGAKATTPAFTVRRG
jgi:subtilisin family serine protease